MIIKKDKVAVVGASGDISKYGYIASKDLIEKGYDVFLVNPKTKEILGQPVYEKISDIDSTIDLVIFVVPPAVTLKVLKEVKELGIKKVWMQPGSESSEAIKFCSDNNIECIHNACIMMK